MDLSTGASLLQIDAIDDVIDAATYTVILHNGRGEQTTLREDETGIILDRDGHQAPLDESPVTLPSFQGLASMSYVV